MIESIRIIGYEDYELFNNGTIYSHKTNRFLKPGIRNGYLSIRCYGGSRDIFLQENIHRLVGIYFVEGQSDEMCEINHIDGNLLNNNYWNLEWVTPLYNKEHALVNGLYNFVSQNPLYMYDNILKQLYFFRFQADVERYFKNVTNRGLRKAFLNNGKKYKHFSISREINKIEKFDKNILTNSDIDDIIIV